MAPNFQAEAERVLLSAGSFFHPSLRDEQRQLFAQALREMYARAHRDIAQEARNAVQSSEEKDGERREVLWQFAEALAEKATRCALGGT